MQGSSDRLASERDVSKLSNGLLMLYEEPLTKVAKNLNELTSKQATLIEAVSIQNRKLQATQNNEAMKAMFADVIHCKEQLIQIKKQMAAAHDKSNRLKIRAQNVMTFAKNKQSARLAELENEQKLIGGQL